MSDQQTLSFQITGLNCAGCAGRAERALAAVAGVESASVNLATSTGQVMALDATPVAIAEALQSAGYPAAETTLSFAVRGMNCGSCVARLETVLATVPGVIAASVNLAAETAEVRLLKGASGHDELIAAAQSAGYSMEPLGREADAPDPSQQREEERNQEAQGLRQNALIAGLLTLPVFVIEMGGHLIPGVHHWVMANVGQQTSHLLQFVLVTLVLIGPGRSFYSKGIAALLRRAPDMNALVALGTGAAYGFSIVATFAPQILPEGSANVYFEAAAVIVVLILIGRWLETRAKGRTGAAIRALVGLQPKMALLVVPGGELRETPVATVAVGDRIRLLPGARVPVDGEVLHGDSFVDESMISGEPLPVQKHAGVDLTAGTVNGAGTLDFRATRVGRDTVLAQIIRMVEQAQGAKLPVQGMVDRITLWFVPAVMAMSLLTVLIWAVFGPSPALPFALVAGVSVLIIACPCAMGLATPTSIMVAIGRAAQMGVLFRKGDALQALNDVRLVAFDKTGTLTEGRPQLSQLIPAPGVDGQALLRFVAAAEVHSEHPVARALVAAHQGDLPEASDLEILPGLGLTARVEGKALHIGSEKLMQQIGCDLAGFSQQSGALRNRGETVFFAALEGEISGLISVADPVRAESHAAVSALQDAGLKVAMISGDAGATAQAIAADLGIGIVVADCMPKDKASAVERLRAEHGSVAFVGDGINDAPALACADVGIAIGTGTDVAIEAADVVLVSGEPRGVANARKVSTRTMRNIRQNLFWAFGYNVVLIPVAAGVLYPFGGPMLSPMLGAGAMALSSVFVLTNALRLRRLSPDVDDRGREGARQSRTQQQEGMA